jgi:DNA-directed RNA polymerase subunit H (RpoH/RPB5)
MDGNNSTLLNQLYQSRKNLLEIFETNGYDTSNYNGFSQHEIHIMEESKELDMLIEKKNKSHKVYVHYYFEKTLKENNLRLMIDELFENTAKLTKNDTLFIIREEEPNETLYKDLKQIWDTSGIYIIVERRKYLLYNILNHILQPKFKIIEEMNEMEEIKKRYNIADMNNFPNISRFDPVARVLCLRPGQLLLCSRASKTAINSDYYRICI